MAKIVAVSGGADSMALLHFIKNKFPKEKIICAHFNHLWSSNKNNGLAVELVESFCLENDITFFYGEPEEDCDNSETKSRKERMQFFKKVSEKFGSSEIYLAHHKSDNAETIFFRFVRGTGISGLIGMQEETALELNDTRLIFCRPFINSMSKQDLYSYCEKFSIPFIEDPSNQDESKKRNLIRHSIFSLLKQINPSFETAILRLSQICKENQEFIDHYIGIFDQEIRQSDNQYNLTKFRSHKSSKVNHFWLKKKLRFANHKDLQEALDFLNKNGKFINRKQESELKIRKGIYTITVSGDRFSIREEI